MEDKLNTLYSIVENNDFPKYIEWRIQLEHENIANMEEQIAIHEQAIIENPSQEDSLNEIIENLKRQIDLIKTNTIPILELRLRGILFRKTFGRTQPCLISKTAETRYRGQK